MKRNKIICIGCSVLMCATILTGCGNKGRIEDETASQTALENANDSVGYPEIKNFTEKKNLKEILELRDDPNLICYYYTKNQMDGKYVYQGRCQGYGVPYASSFTSPEYLEHESTTLPLPDPNGMYMQGLSTSATFVMHINEKTNEKEPRYVEEEITVSKTKIDKRLCESWSLPDNY